MLSKKPHPIEGFSDKRKKFNTTILTICQYFYALFFTLPDAFSSGYHANPFQRPFLDMHIDRSEFISYFLTQDETM